MCHIQTHIAFRTIRQSGRSMNSRIEKDILNVKADDVLNATHAMT